MPNDDREKWIRLPKLKINSQIIKKHFHKAQNVTVRHAHKFIISRWGSVRESQRHITVWVLIVGLIIAATGFQLMWYQKNYRTNGPLKTGTYAEAVLGPLNTMNPLFADSSAEQSASSLLFSRLLNYDNTGHLSYDIVKNITMNDAKTVYTVTIRSDVKWHDGTVLTTEDVAFTIGLIKNPIIRSSIEGWDNITVKVINATTIEFSMQSVYAAFRHLLTFPILPKHLLGTVPADKIRENDFSNNPVGSGPFKLSFIQDVDAASNRKVIYLVRNPDYYGGLAKLAKFQLHIYETSDSIVRGLALNEINAAIDLSPTDISKIKTDKDTIISEPIQSGVFAIFNTTTGTLSDVNMRKALQIATNAAEIRKDLGANSPSLDLPFTNGQLTGALPTLPEYDIAGANKILDDAGWLTGINGIRAKDGVELELSIVVLKDSELEKVLELLVAQWRKLGVSVETKIVDPDDASQNVVQKILQPRAYDVLLYRLYIGADPDVFAYWHSSQANAKGLNFANYSNLVADDALATARTRTEMDLRNAKYITFAKQWIADVPAIGLYQSTAIYVHSDEVKTFDKTNVLNSATDRYSDILNWSVGTKSVYKTP